MAFPLPEVRIGAFIMSPFNPNRRRFYSYIDLEEFVSHKINPTVIPNTTVYFDQPWLSNIGHALFDGLYPAYVALIRFQPKHLQPFRILLHTMSDNGKYSFSQNVYNVFAGLDTINASVLETMSAGRWFAFQEIVMGSGNMCQRCLQSNLQLPGGIELNGSKLFRDRMYKQHKLSPPTIRKNHSFERQYLRRPLKAYVIHNKRFTDDDKIEIQAAIDEINKYTAANKNQTTENGEKLRWPLVHVTYTSYPLIVAREEAKSQFSTHIIQSKTIISKSKMMAHLQLLQNMDIHITGPGTGQMYQTFLPDGSVNINLGGLGYKKQKNITKTYTSFLEQYVTAGTPYIKGLYYPINERPLGIKREIVVQLIRKAAQLILNAFTIPVHPRENLASDGQLFTEMCEQDQQFCMAATERSEKNSFWCINTWPEEIINENGPWSSKGIIDGDKTVMCPCNRTLLHQLRRKYNIDYHVKIISNKTL
ncbi:unnamed protein product [Rotaria socialis]|uniref:Uncharacterized protein n=1 Tax=Rotaria socialis TaxID=392032 RepID=A0A818WYP3_9BILA|nr:unnamed protein product [Rotaria socialis]CAF4480005.1 unnamed protein product [Rotaria socialis]